MNFSTLISYAMRSVTTRLIALNCAVFIVLTVVNLILGFYGLPAGSLTQWLVLPGSMDVFVSRPWTLLTYMVVNTDLFRLAFNMLWLLCFGRVLDNLVSPRSLLWLYVTAGVAGGVLYLVGSVLNWWNAVWLIGSSAPVVAWAVAGALTMPKYRINLLILGPVQVVWVAVCVLFLYFIDIDSSNIGGNAAHLGGALAGMVWVGRNILRGKRHRPSFLKIRRKPVNAGTPKNYTERQRQADLKRLQSLVAKVQRGGYGALSLSEHQEMIKLTQRLK